MQPNPNLLDAAGFTFGAIGRSPSPPSLLRRFTALSDNDTSPHEFVLSPSDEVDTPFMGTAPNVEDPAPPAAARMTEGTVHVSSSIPVPSTPVALTLASRTSRQSSQSQALPVPSLLQTPSSGTLAASGAPSTSNHHPQPLQPTAPQQPSSHNQSVAASVHYISLSSELAKERAIWDELQTLRLRYREEHEELRRRHEETMRAAQREREQAERTFARLDAAFESLERLRPKQERRWTDEQSKALRDVQLAAKLQDEKEKARQRAPSATINSSALAASNVVKPQTTSVVPVQSLGGDSAEAVPPIAPPTSTATPSAPPAPLNTQNGVKAETSSSVPATSLVPVPDPQALAEEERRKRQYEEARRLVQENKMRANAEYVQKIRDRRTLEASKAASKENGDATAASATTLPAKINVLAPTQTAASSPASQVKASVVTPPAKSVTPSPSGPGQLASHDSKPPLNNRTVTPGAPKPQSTTFQAEATGTTDSSVVPRKRSGDAINYPDNTIPSGSPPETSKRSRNSPPSNSPGLTASRTASGMENKIASSQLKSTSPPGPVEHAATLSPAVEVKQEPSSLPDATLLSTSSSALSLVQTDQSHSSADAPTLSTTTAARVPHVRPVFSSEGDRSTRVIDTNRVREESQVACASPRIEQEIRNPNDRSPVGSREKRLSIHRDRYQPTEYGRLYAETTTAVNHDYGYGDDAMVNSMVPAPTLPPRSPSPRRGREREYDTYVPQSSPHPPRARAARSPLRGSRRAARRTFDHYSPSPEPAQWRPRFNEEPHGEGQHSRPGVGHSRSRSPPPLRSSGHMQVGWGSPVPRSPDYRQEMWGSQDQGWSWGDDRRDGAGNYASDSQYYRQPYNPPVPVAAPSDAGWSTVVSAGSSLTPPSPPPRQREISPDWGAPARSAPLAPAQQQSWPQTSAPASVPVATSSYGSGSNNDDYTRGANGRDLLNRIAGADEPKTQASSGSGKANTTTSPGRKRLRVTRDRYDLTGRGGTVGGKDQGSRGGRRGGGGGADQRSLAQRMRIEKPHLAKRLSS